MTSCPASCRTAHHSYLRFLSHISGWCPAFGVALLFTSQTTEGLKAGKPATTAMCLMSVKLQDWLMGPWLLCWFLVIPSQQNISRYDTMDAFVTFSWRSVRGWRCWETLPVSLSAGRHSVATEPNTQYFSIADMSHTVLHHIMTHKVCLLGLYLQCTFTF